MVMELLEGDTLATRLNDYRARSERMPLGEVVRVLLDVLDGLAYAHSEGMIHRDVKPANVLLTRRGQAVLTDFGIAQIVGGTKYTVTGALMGTLAYMAPEQGLEGHCDARSDLYSLGIVLYEMLTGEPPFDAETPLAILMKHVNDPLPLPRQIEPGIPLSLERVVLKVLSKRPQDRYQSAAGDGRGAAVGGGTGRHQAAVAHLAAAVVHHARGAIRVGGGVVGHGPRQDASRPSLPPRTPTPGWARSWRPRRRRNQRRQKAVSTCRCMSRESQRGALPMRR